DPDLPEELLEEQLSGLVAQYGAEMVDSPLRFSFSLGEELSQWVFALVAPFAAVQDSIEGQDFLTFWQTGISSAADELVVEQAAFSGLSQRYGMPAENVKVMASDEILLYCQA